MSAASERDASLDSDWSSSAEPRPAAVPSWLAPPFESNSFPIVRAVEPASQRETEADEAEAHILRRLTLAPQRLPRLEEDVVTPAAPPYPDLRDENEALSARVAELTTAVGSIRRAILDASEGEIVRLACAIAERITRRELTTDPSLVIGWVKEATETLATSEGTTLVVSPDVATALGEEVFRHALPTLAAVEVDPTLGSMMCEVRTGPSRVGASLEERLHAVVEDLGIGRP